MTRKDYVQAARLVAAIPKQSCRENTALLFVRFFAAENPSFDSVRFMHAAGAETVKVGTWLNTLAIAKEVPRRRAA